MKAVEIRDLRKKYGDLEALRGVSLTIDEGEIFGLLGPNGAGKTTTVEILAGLRSRDHGSVTVFGLDPATEPRDLPRVLSLAPQHMDFLDNVKVREVLHLFAGLFRMKDRLAEVIGRFQLDEILDRQFQHLSGGQRQRLNLAVALLHRPRLIILDEPTTGLDPQTRVYIHDLIREIRDQGCTLIITTHYIEEAEKLCDRVAIIDHGRIIALDTPVSLIQQYGGRTRVEVTLSRPGVRFPAFENVETRSFDDGTWVFWVDDPTRFLPRVYRVIREQGGELVRMALYSPTLEDVFIHLTGRQFRD